MAKLIVGIQGSIGSVNERGCRFFAEKYQWSDFEIKYMISTENVLQALSDGSIHLGTFAWESSRAGLVQETQTAIQRFVFTKIDEEWFSPRHALLMNTALDTSESITIYSHPQALCEHKPYLTTTFPSVVLKEEVDTAIAAQNLKTGKYPQNTLVIAPIECAELYDLCVYKSDLPSNIGYYTKIVLVKKPPTESN